MDNYDKFINHLLDKNQYKTWEQIKAEYKANRPDDAPPGSCNLCGSESLTRKLYTDDEIYCTNCGTLQAEKTTPELRSVT